MCFLSFLSLLSQDSETGCNQSKPRRPGAENKTEEAEGTAAAEGRKGMQAEGRKGTAGTQVEGTAGKGTEGQGTEGEGTEGQGTDGTRAERR